MDNKAFKWPYLAALLLSFILIFVLSITVLMDKDDNYKQKANFDTEKAYGYITEIAKETHPRNSVAHESAFDYIIDALIDFQVQPVVTDYRYNYRSGTVLVPDTELKNIIVEFNGTKRPDDILLIMAHYDSVPMGPGASDDTIPVAAMLEIIRQIKSANMTFENSVVFLITDGEEEGLCGARYFAEQRETVSVRRFTTKNNPTDISGAEKTGYEKLAGKVKFVTNWEMRGTGGSLIMFETTKGNHESVKRFAKINKDIYTNSIANFIYTMMPNGTDFTELQKKGVQGLNFASIGEGYNYHTQDDSISNVSKSILAQTGNAMWSSIDYFSAMNLTDLYKSQNNAVFQSYLNMFTAVYPSALVIVFSIITLLLIVGAIIANLKMKKYSFKKFSLGLASNLIALAAAVLTAFLFKTVLGLIPSLGRLLGSGSFSIYFPLFGYLFLMAGIYTIAVSLMNKAFKVDKNEYNMLAHCFFIAFLGSIVSFILPEISILLSPAGFIAAIILAVSAAVPKFDTHKLWLGFVPAIVMLPIAISLMLLAADALGLTLGWITAVTVLLAFGFVLPYINDARNFISEKITENIEDNKLIKCVKTAGRKSNYITAGIAAFVGFIMILSVTAFPVTISTNIYGKASGILFTDDAIVYRKDFDTAEEIYIMYDKAAFEYLEKNYDITGNYNNVYGGYVLPVSGAVTVAAPKVTTLKQSGYYQIDIEKNYENGVFSLYFPFDSGEDSSITKIEITDALGTTVLLKENYIEAMRKVREVQLRSYENSTIKVYTTTSSLEFLYAETAYLTFNVEKINKIREAEQNLKTTVRSLKTYTVT